MASLEKGSRYSKNNLDFTLVNKEYEVVGRIYYVQAKCNTCGKKVKLHRGKWATDTLDGCPNCLKKNKSITKESKPVVVGVGAVKPLVKLNSTTQEPKIRPVVKVDKSSQSQNGTIAIGLTVCNCKIDTIKGDIVTLTCQKCKSKIQISKQLVSDKIRSNDAICKCDELEKANVGLIKAVGLENTKRDKPLRELPGWIYMDKRTKNKSIYYIYRCAICGIAEEFNENSVLNNKCNCKHCAKLLKTKQQPIGSSDWTGYITKCRRVDRVYTTDNNIKMAEMRCLICNCVENIALISVIKDEIQVCDACATKQLVLNCPICEKNHLKNNLKGLYSEVKSDIICINKNEKIPKEELVDEHDSRVRMQYITKKYRGRYTYKSRLRANGERAQLFIFNEGYIGTDKKEYSSCMCVEHNKFLCLTEEEQSSYCHEFCDNVRMIPYKGDKSVK